MKYITLNDLSETIRKNIWKIPHDIDFIIGIPRSGMIGASIISCLLNVPLIDINGFLNGIKPYGGGRLTNSLLEKNNIKTNKVLIIDDTVWAGSAMNKTKQQLSKYTEYQFIYCCIYLEGPAVNVPDIYLEDVRHYSNENFTEVILHEWNIFQHDTHLMSQFLFDIDGVFCIDPPCDIYEEQYINYIKDATPLFIPRTPIGGIVTFRIVKNKEYTVNWLKKVGIAYNELFMFNAQDRIIRDTSGISSGYYKGIIYRDRPYYKLFIESDDDQAKEIAQVSGKQVFCVKTNKMYND